MYTDFYNLKEKPFSLSPSSRSLYLGDIHKEALALLTYGVMDRKGFILLTGEVGTGKTTMVHALLGSLGKDIQYVYLSNPLFSVKDFMNYLAFSAFKKKFNFENKTDFLIHFEGFLQEQHRNRKNFILIIDEAQKLSFELLEEIRLLSNMETSEEKLINIFLVGQPELNELLNQPRCRPLLQRISIRYHMKALDEASALDYIATRLKKSGAEDVDRIIPKKVAKAIYQYSDGYPRMINVLADNVLLLGYARGDSHITTSMVKECYDDLQLEGSFFDSEKHKEIMKTKRRGLFGLLRDFKWAALF
jgi:general secretion pathway protein A